MSPILLARAGCTNTVLLSLCPNAVLLTVLQICEKLMNRVSSRIQSFTVFVVISLSWLGPAASSFREGEFVPTARRAQFHGVRLCLSLSGLESCRFAASTVALQARTTWHDLLGRHCPRFGQDRVVSKCNSRNFVGCSLLVLRLAWRR